MATNTTRGLAKAVQGNTGVVLLLGEGTYEATVPSMAKPQQ